jgi:IS30 family transposase
MTFKAIGRQIGKDQTTVSKEVKKHLVVSPSSIKHTNSKGEVIESICPSLLKAPFVCNACKRRHSACGFQKQLYYAKGAQKAYASLLTEARVGIPLNKESFYEMDAVITNGIHRGQHLYHIMQTTELGVSKSTVYRHLKRGYLSVSPIDFPRVVKFKTRRQHQEDRIPKTAKIGRTYADFLAYTEEHAASSWVEMDTVIGRIGGKAILTLDFTFCNFMVGLLLEDKTALQTARKIIGLKANLTTGGFRFGDVFPIILTDNGGEFALVDAFENDSNGEPESALFFCDPMHASQKPHVEKNHTLFRDIVPKGNSFDLFTQETVNRIFSHVNCVKRLSLNGKSPYEILAFTYGDSLASLFGITFVSADCVLQSPKLLRTL